MRVAYETNTRLTVFARAGATLAVTNRTDTGRRAAISPGRIEAFGSAWSFPLTAGLHLRM